MAGSTLIYGRALFRMTRFGTGPVTKQRRDSYRAVMRERIDRTMVAVAQLVRAPDCGSGGWGFKSPQSPLGLSTGGRTRHAEYMPSRSA